MADGAGGTGGGDSDSGVGSGDAPPPGRGTGRGWRRDRRLLAGALLASTLALAAVLVLSAWTQRDALAVSLRRVTLPTVAIAVALHLAALGFWALRLRLMADAFGHRVPLRSAAGGVLAGVFAAAVTPARAGGEPVRAAALVGAGVPKREAGLAVAAGRALDIVLFIVLGAAAGLLLLPRLPGLDGIGVALALVAAVLVGALALAVLALLRPAAAVRLLDPFGRLLGEERTRDLKARVVHEATYARHAVARAHRDRPAALLAALGATVLTWLTEFAVAAHLLAALGHPLPFALVVLAASLVTLLTLVPLLPGGSGVAELGMLAVFAPLAPGLTAAFVLVWRATTYYVDLLVGGVVALRMSGAAGMRALREAPGGGPSPSKGPSRGSTQEPTQGPSQEPSQEPSEGPPKKAPTRPSASASSRGASPGAPQAAGAKPDPAAQEEPSDAPAPGSSRADREAADGD